MSNCPCCSHTMLRRIFSKQVYWFCRTCWPEMPYVEKNCNISVLVNLSTTLGTLEQNHKLIKI